jgi:hypothetical protein
VGSGLAAAAALLFWLLGAEPSVEAWRIDSTAASLAGVVLDGRPVGASAPESLAAQLSSTHELRTGEHPLRLRFGRLLLVEMDPDSVLDLSRMPRGTADGNLVLASNRGGFRLATGPDFPGRELVFDTPDLEASVVGTIFGIDVFPDKGSCVCCIESEVLVRSKKAERELQHVGRDRTGFVDIAGDAMSLEIVPEHAGPLRQLRVEW